MNPEPNPPVIDLVTISIGGDNNVRVITTQTLCQQQIVNDMVDFLVSGTSFDPEPVDDGPAGTFTITAVLTNISLKNINEPVKSIVHQYGSA